MLEGRPLRRRRNNVRVGCAILAAGAGRRFGGPAEKLVAQHLGKRLLQHAVDSASESPATHCSLILGAAPDVVRALIDERRCAVLLNVKWTEGIASSVRCAAEAHAQDDGCILMLGDQPRVTATDLARMIAVFADKPQSIVALRRDEVWGAPVLFGRADFAALASLRGDSGAKSYASSQRRRLRFVDASMPDAFADVDVVADLR